VALKYRIVASMDTYHRIDVEAETVEDARNIAEQTDIERWIPETLIGAGLTIWEVHPIKGDFEIVP
jgi:hypothetical protein